jgi:ethanolamine ammonia-lyase small subunit
MLGYLTTSCREHPNLRSRVGRRMTSTMQRRLTALGALDGDGDPRPGPDTIARLYAMYMKAGGERGPASSFEDEGRRRLSDLRERGFDLGVAAPPDAEARVDAIYAHARGALYATVADGVIADAAPRHVRVRTAAASRDDYLAHPPAGERVRDDDARRVAALYPARPPQVQLVVSDGLNANAINEQLRALLPPLRRLTSGAGYHVGEHEIVVQNGRVRAGYEIGALVGAAVVVHVIGERPGTGLNTASAYLTYGYDALGRPRWSRDLDHAATTAICGIHPKGKPPEAAAAEIARTVARIVEQRRSGVALKATVEGF